MPRYDQESLPPYVGLTGPAGCGKDTAAIGLCASLGYERFAFADPIKDALAAMTGIDRSELDDRDRKEHPIEGLGVSPRRLAQTLGTEWGRDVVDQEWWLKLMAFRSREAPLVVIPDVRFDNEAGWIRQRGGIVVQLSRPSIQAVEQHASEAGVSRELIDLHLSNSGSVVDLRDSLVRWIERISGLQRRDAQASTSHGETARSTG